MSCFLKYTAKHIGQSTLINIENRTRTLFVVGGLYGNLEALKIISQRAKNENALVVFNGDFNFFNTTRETWDELNERVLTLDGSELSILGNVEKSACSPLEYSGCGCNYPSYVGESVPRWADEIVAKLHQAAQSSSSSIGKKLLELPDFRVIKFGGERIGIIHGDFENIAGWKLSLESLYPLNTRVRNLLNVPASEISSPEYVQKGFQDADISLLCCSHTCVPFAQRISFHTGNGRHQKGAIFNNGAAGIPNFRNNLFGVMTRISVDTSPPLDSLWGGPVGNIRVDAVPIRYDIFGFAKLFATLHAQGSAASLSYGSRIQRGLNWWTVENALERWSNST
jgi:hypothetical protein